MCNLSSEGYLIDADHCPEHTCNGKVYREYNEHRLFNNLTFLKRLFNYSKYTNNPNYQYIMTNHDLKLICQGA